MISEQILTLASCCDPFVNSIPLDSIGCSVSLGIQQFHIQSHTRRCVLLKLPPHASLTPFIEILWFKVFEDLLTYSKRLVQNVLGSLQYKQERKFWVRILEGAAYFQPYRIPNVVDEAKVGNK